jgi:thioredoxin reductase (NADPH)
MREVELAIVGAGVAGLVAAQAAARSGIGVLVIERMGAGGQVMSVERIDGMPGFEDGISGFELGPELQERAESAGAEFALDTVLALAPGAGPEGRHVLQCEGDTFAARAVLLAAGSSIRKLGVPGEGELEGRGVSHCASCDGPLLRGQDVVVVGGGDSAFGEARVLAVFARQVTVVFPDVQPHAQVALIEDVARLANVVIKPGVRVTKIIGSDAGVEGVRFADALTPALSQREREQDGVLAVQGLFAYPGLVANTDFIAEVLDRDAASRIVTDSALRTSVPGVFAAGDIRSGCDWRLAAAVRDGEAAAASIKNHLREGDQA